MRDLTHKVVAVTGAGSGIGRALAGDLAGRGARLALSDVDAEGLAGTVDGLPPGTEVLAERVDVTDADALVDHERAVGERFGHADAVVANAGIAHDGVDLVDFDPDAFARVLDVDLHGVVHTVRAFLPGLLARPEAAVVVVSSVFGLLGVARQSAYCTAKFAVRGFADSLRMELALSAPHVRVTTVHPGGVRTAIARRSVAASRSRSAEQHRADAETFESLLRIPPEKAARTIVEGVRRGRPRVLVGADAVALDAAARLVPGALSRLGAAAAVRLGAVAT